jgi:sugar lactone lactonase YvrE
MTNDRSVQETELVVDGLKYPEGLRWHQDRLWFSDMLDDRVYSWNESSGLHPEFSIGEPSGLGFLPDGRVLVVGRSETQVFGAYPGAEPQQFTSFSGIVGINDMVTDGSGLTYVGALGKRYELGDEDRIWDDDAPGQILLIRPDGEYQVVASGLACPNGMVITPDGSTLVVAETYRSRLVAFRRAPDGSLSDRQIVAALDEEMVDGLTSDAEGSSWVGAGKRFVKVDAGGHVVDTIEVPGYRCIACMLGGAERRTLYLAVCQMTMETFVQRQSVGRILACETAVPGAGLP